MVRRARRGDVPGILALIEPYVAADVLLRRSRADLEAAVEQFVVAVTTPTGVAGGVHAGQRVVGCASLRVLAPELGEIRTVAVAPDQRGAGTGRALVQQLMRRTTDLGLRRVICLTFHIDFFRHFGFEPAVLDERLARELRPLMQRDEGVAEFVDLHRLWPNTLGNTRMIWRAPTGCA